MGLPYPASPGYPRHDDGDADIVSWFPKGLSKSQASWGLIVTYSNPRLSSLQDRLHAQEPLLRSQFKPLWRPTISVQ